MNKSVQFSTQLPQPTLKPVTDVQQLLPLLGRTLSYVKVNEELDRRALIVTGALANVISPKFYKDLISTNMSSITEIEKPDLEKNGKWKNS